MSDLSAAAAIPVLCRDKARSKRNNLQGCADKLPGGVAFPVTQDIMADRILFVDDEPAVLEGYKRILYPEFSIDIAGRRCQRVRRHGEEWTLFRCDLGHANAGNEWG